MENEIIQEVMENNNEVAENMVYETYPIEEITDDGSSLKEKLVKGGIFAAGAAAGAITTKVVVPGAKRAFGWAKEHWPFKKKSEDAEESETEAKEKEEETDEAEVEEKKPDNNNHKKGKKKK